MTRSKVIAKKRFKTEMEFTGSGSRLGGLLKFEKMLVRTLRTCFNSLNMMLTISLKLLIEP